MLVLALGLVKFDYIAYNLLFYVYVQILGQTVYNIFKEKICLIIKRL